MQSYNINKIYVYFLEEVFRSVPLINLTILVLCLYVIMTDDIKNNVAIDNTQYTPVSTISTISIGTFNKNE